MYNQKRFSLEAFDSSKIISESRTEWIPINSQIREEIVYKVSLMHLDLQDRIWQWSTWTKEDYDVFKIHETKKRPYEFKDNVHIEVTFEFNLDFTITDRQVYSVLDWLGDTGGLVDALLIIGASVLILINYTKFDYLIAQNLYKIR